MIYASVLAYLVDANNGRSSTAFAANSVFRGVCAFAATEIAVPLQDSLGDGWMYTIWGFVMILTEVLILLVMWRGTAVEWSSLYVELNRSLPISTTLSTWNADKWCQSPVVWLPFFPDFFLFFLRLSARLPKSILKAYMAASTRRRQRETNGSAKEEVDPGVTLAQAAPAMLDIYAIVSLVLGGCCANVLAYEQLLKINPQMGSALTFSQMLFISLHSLPSFLSFKSPRSIPIPTLKPRQVPLYNWALQVGLLISGSLMNNWVFAFDVPLTVQIVFRSAGLPVSMLLGYFVLKKRYTILQVTSVALVSFGVVLATLSRPSSSSSQATHDVGKYAIGVTMLVVSLFLTAFLGLLQERTYKKYGPCWKEGVFYTHFLSLPVFVFLASDVKQGIQSLASPASGAVSSTWISPFVVLAANLVSQLVCVSGVNRLSSQVSSVSTNIVLTTRKALSLCLSVWWFGNLWNWKLGIGAGMVFIGSSLFTLGSQGKGETIPKVREQAKRKEE
ncbi:hypothetical protein ONZ45_g5768 [Pleurotus djamor]|nr:hypothetical protein ONZ45_g5768 [Pleurotus djamor]